MSENTQQKPKRVKGPSIMDFTSEYGNKYKFQRVLPSAWIDIVDKTTLPTGKRDRKSYIRELLEHVVVQPKMSIDDFAGEGFGDFDELDEVVGAAIRFQQG
jgi:hypothetical protein